MAFTFVTITHTFEVASDLSAVGVVEFVPVEPMHNGLTVIAAPVTATLSGAGVLSQRLAANTDPATQPTGTTYKVTERLTGQPVLSYYVQVPHDQGSTLDLRDLAGWVGGTGTGGGGGGGVLTINGEAPDGAGNVVVSAADVGAQPADADLTGLAGLGDGIPRRTGGAWAARTAQQLAVDLAVAPTPVTLTASSGVITPNAALGPGPHRYTATADVTLGAPIGGVDGQAITVAVTASGAQRILSFPGGTVPSVPIAIGDTYVAELLYDLADDEWKLRDGSGGGGGSGSGELADGSVTLSKLATTGAASSSTFLRGDGAWAAVSGGSGAVSSVNGQTGAVVLTPDSFTDGSTNHVFTAADDTKLGGIASGATANATDAQLRDRATHTGTQSADTLTDGTSNKAFTAPERTKLGGIASGATANATDAQLRDRATHTGTQTSATISDFAETAQDSAAALFSAGAHSGITFTYDDTNNKINASVTSAEGSTFTGNKTINGRFGVNKTTSVKQPINMGATLNAASVSGSTDDKITIELSGNFTGDFTGDSGSNPGFVWGVNGFFTTGSSANDGKGLTDVTGGLIEMCVQTPAGTTFPVVRGFQAEAAFFGASAGATVTQMESMRVSAPKRKDGATAGTATTAYGLFIESTDAYNVGATNSWALFVEGGVSRFQGRVDIDETLVAFGGTLSLQGDYSGAGKIQLTTNNIGFFGVTPVARQTLPASGSVTAANIRTALINLGLCQ